MADGSGAGVPVRTRWFVDWLPRSPWHRVEFLLASLLAVCFCSTWFIVPDLRPLWRWAYSFSVVGTAPSAWSLLASDTQGTAGLLAKIVGRFLITYLPTFVLLARMPRHRFAWLPIPLALLPFLDLMGLLSCPRPWHWAVLSIVSVAATLLVRRRRLWFMAVLPVVARLFLTPFFFQPDGDDADRLRARCLKNEGELPSNLEPAHLGREFVAAIEVAPDWLFLSERESDSSSRQGSQLLHREGDRYRIVREVQPAGNFWRGCIIDEKLWLLRTKTLVEVPLNRSSDIPMGATDTVVRRPVKGEEPEMDVTELTCDVARKRIYFGEASRGGLWSYSVDEAKLSRQQLEGEAMFPRRRSDGLLAVATVHDLLTYDPDSKAVVSRIPASMYSIGSFDLCEKDNTAVVHDFAGRMRFFTATGTAYRFDWGLDLPAARRVRFSPDCRYIAATGMDDGTVIIVDRERRAVVRQLTVGPRPREATFVGEREVVIADRCSASLVRFEDESPPEHPDGVAVIR